MAKFKGYQDYNKTPTLYTGIADLEPYIITLPDAPKPELITNFGKPIEEQVFQRVQIPYDLKKIDALVKTGQLERGDALKKIESDPELCAFAEMLWRKRTGQELEFQYINGVPLHIPPEYWMYLNFWEMPREAHDRPEFRVDFYHYCTDLWFFSLWRYHVLDNLYTNGLINFTQRQVGKSFIAGLLGYEYISYKYEAHAGMQSKTDPDAAKIFNKCIVRPWSNLLFLFQPAYSNSSFPKAEGLQFTPYADNTKKATVNIVDEKHLMGSFTYKSSGESAYDGDTLDFYLCDEAGKTLVASVVRRWEVVKESLKRRGGKTLFTTTVEEMEKGGGKEFKSIWDDSDRSPTKKSQSDVKVDENGETVSGLHPTFSPSYCNEHFDYNGISIVDRITEKQKIYLKSVAAKKKLKYPWLCGIDAIDLQIAKQKDKNKKADVIRKKPRTIKEAFASANQFTYFNREILQARLDYFLHGYPNQILPVNEFSATDIRVGEDYSQFADGKMRWGKFDWIGDPYNSLVKFTPTSFEDARLHVTYLLRDGMRNKRVPKGNKFEPANCAFLRSGADPFKYETKDVKNPSKMSDGAQHIYMFYDTLVDGARPVEDRITNNFIMEYLFRPPGKEDLFDDYAKACIFYGCSVYPELNNSEVLDYFKRKGMEYYIQHGLRVALAPGEGLGYKYDAMGGDITNNLTIEKMFRHIEDFVNKDAKYCRFYRTLQDIMDVERDNLNPYDLFVSAAYTLMASYESEIVRSIQHNQSAVDLDDIKELTGYEFLSS